MSKESSFKKLLIELRVLNLKIALGTLPAHLRHIAYNNHTLYLKLSRMEPKTASLLLTQLYKDVI